MAERNQQVLEAKATMDGARKRHERELQPGSAAGIGARAGFFRAFPFKG